MELDTSNYREGRKLISSRDACSLKEHSPMWLTCSFVYWLLLFLTSFWKTMIYTSAKLQFVHYPLRNLQVRYDPGSHVKSPKWLCLIKTVTHTFEPNHGVMLMCKSGLISYVQHPVSMHIVHAFYLFGERRRWDRSFFYQILIGGNWLKPLCIFVQSSLTYSHTER